MSGRKKVKEVLKTKPWPPETNPKPKEVGLSPKNTDKFVKAEKRMDEPVIKSEPPEAKKSTTRETQTDKDEDLVPISTADAQNVASDEYVRVDFKSHGNDATPVNENTVEVNTTAPSDTQHLHVHIHISPSQTGQSNSRWTVTINQKGAEKAAPPPPPPPRTPPLPPRTAQPGGKSEESSESTKGSEESSDSDKDGIDVQEILKGKPSDKKHIRHDYDEINYGANAPNAEGTQESSSGTLKEKHTPTRPSWLFKNTDKDEAEESVQTDKNGSFAVVQENEEEMPFTPYTLIVVHNGQLKRLPFMKQEAGILGKEKKYTLANSSKSMKSVEELVSYFQKNEIGLLKLKLLAPKK